MIMVIGEWFKQAKDIGKLKIHTLFPNEKIAKIFNLSKDYVDKLLLLYYFILHYHYSHEKIVYEGRIFSTDYIYVLVEEITGSPVESMKQVVRINRPVGFNEAWRIYSYHLERSRQWVDEQFPIE
jgi:hypothetical protein